MRSLLGLCPQLERVYVDRSAQITIEEWRNTPTYAQLRRYGAVRIGEQDLFAMLMHLPNVLPNIEYVQVQSMSYSQLSYIEPKTRLNT